MYHPRFSWTILGFAITMLLALQPKSAHAQYTPPNHVIVTMYSLTEPGGGMLEPPVPCTKDDRSYGCTAVKDDDTYAYPFNDSTITISIEETDGPDNNVYGYAYLKDVIAQEMSPSSFLQPALDAQAIAARTYAYWHINATGRLNNSNQHHVFLPYRYQQFADADQRKIDSAVANRYYMSYHRSFFNGFRTVPADEPIFSEFSTDAYQQSRTHAEQNPRHPYLLGVEDPLSFHPDIPPLIAATNAHQRGLSQNGAGRWARASTSFRCDPAPAPCEPPPSVPHTPWSVRWLYPAQILSHYYTGIHLRDANAGNRIVTPAYRWVPLRVKWEGRGLDVLCPGEVVTVTFSLQNTGTAAWELNGAFRFDYAIESIPGGPTVQGQATVDDAVIEPGERYTPTLTIPATAIGPVGTAKLVVFDMYRGTAGPFRNLESADGRPWYDFAEELRVAECYNAYLPIVQGGPNVAVNH